MTILSYLQLKYNNFYTSFNYSDAEFRLNLLKKVIGCWVILSLLPTLVFYDVAYELNFTDEKPWLIFFVETLPSSIRDVLVLKSFILTFILAILLPFVSFSNRSHAILSFFFCIILNLHLLLNSRVTSGATSIVATMSTYLFLYDLIRSLKKRFRKNYELIPALFVSMKFQMCVVYVVAGLVKITSPLWLNGFATYYIFRNERYFRFSWLLDFFDKFDFLYVITSIAPIIFLLVFPLFIWNRFFAHKLIFLSFLFHGFIALTMGLREFMIFPILNLIFFGNFNIPMSMTEMKEDTQEPFHESPI